MASLNYDKLLDYLKTTQRSWKLFMGEYPKTVAQYRATCKALKESTKVEKLKLLFSAECAEDIIDAIRTNTSLKILEFHGVLDPDHKAGVLNALAPKNQIVDLTLRESSWPDIAFRSLISFVNNNKVLQSLNLHSAEWTTVQLEELTAALKTCPNLTKLDLGDLFTLQPPHLMPVVNYLNSTPAIKNCLFELDAEHTEFFTKNLTTPLRKYSHREDKVHQVIEIEEDESVTLEGNSLFSFWDTLPAELTKHIMYDHLNIADLTRFVYCSKVTLALTRRWPLWKEYYLKYFSCVTDEVLELINLMEGWQMLNMTSIDQVWPKDSWQLVLKYTFTAHGPLDPRDFPRDRRPLMRRLLAPVYQLYPQLVGCASAQYKLGLTSEAALGISNPSINYVWFGAVGTHTYSLGFELLRDSTINGIMIYHYNSQNSTQTAHWLFLHYIFDWFTAKSPAEFQSKMKPLVDILLTAQESNNYHRWPSMYRNILDNVAEKMKEKLTEFSTEFTEIIVSEATFIARRCNPNPEKREEFADFIYAWIDRVKQCDSCIAVPDYISLKQVLTSKTAINERWAHAPVRSYSNIGDSTESIYSRYSSTADKRNAKATVKVASKRPKKRSGPTAVTIFARTLVNLIVMPLLKAFWRMSPQDPAYRVYPHLKSYDRRLMNWTFAPIEHVSVSHAQPQAWPVIAVAVAHLIITPLCRVIELLIHRTWTCKQQQQEQQQGQQGREVSEGVRDSAVNHRGAAGASATPSGDEFETQLNEFINVLTRVGLIPHEHITLLRKLFEEFSVNK